MEMKMEMNVTVKLNLLDMLLACSGAGKSINWAKEINDALVLEAESGLGDLVSDYLDEQEFDVSEDVSEEISQNVYNDIDKIKEFKFEFNVEEAFLAEEEDDFTFVEEGEIAITFPIKLDVDNIIDQVG